MYVIQKAKQQILHEIKQAVGSGFVPQMNELTEPPEKDLGDIAYPCFGLSKQLKQSPQDIAQTIAAKIGPKGYVARIRAVGPYVNFYFGGESFCKDVLHEITSQKETYGTSQIGKSKRVMVEYANLNTHKDVHIGHLRNLFLGQAVVNVLKANGFDVIPVAYINDLGMHVAKSVWAVMHLHENEEVLKKDRMKFLREVYIEVTKFMDEFPDTKDQVSITFKHLEDQTGSEVAVWKKTRAWSLSHLKKIYKELGIKVEDWYFESLLINKTKKEIDKLIKKKIVIESEGAWIVDLRDEDLGVNLFVKSDGTLLYNAKDIGLALKKEEDYHSLRSIYVVDARQSHAMQQLFATLRRMGFEKELTHLSYEFVTLKEGVMASRKGNEILFETLRDKMIEHALKETKLRHPNWKSKMISQVSRTVALSAMRFAMLRQDPEKKILFDMEESMVFEGFTGPYILYTYARIFSLLKKAPKHALKKKIFSVSKEEHCLYYLISKYPEVMFNVCQTLKVNQLAQYLFELGKSFSEFYAAVPVLKAEPEFLQQRLLLVESVGQVIKNGMCVLGIDTLDEM